jgi:type IV pilus assembly protein PilX
MRRNPILEAAGNRCAQRGISLIVSLVMLVVVTLIGLAAIGGTLMQEKIAGNAKDTNLAFQAAEAGLRDAETDIAQSITSGSAFTAAGNGGLWTPPSTWPTPGSAPLWQQVDWTGDSNSLNTTRAYGQFTGAQLPGMGTVPPLYAAVPRYVIEKLSKVQPGAGDSMGQGIGASSSAGVYYRVSVYATGGRPDTHVVMQSIYLKH